MRELKDRLRVLDTAEVPDLWPDAEHRTPRLEAEPPTRRSPLASRITAGVVAFAVFIAAGLFAWQAFRPAPVGVQAPGDGVAGVALWPERTATDLAQTQALADSGDPTVAWRLDPKEVASRFAEEILGWGPPRTDSGGLRYAVAVDAGWSPGDPSATVTVSQLAVPCPSPPPGEAGTCPPPYDGETLTLRQLGTTGQAGVWSVTSVVASGITLDLTPGETLTNGTPLKGSVSFPDTWRSVNGFHAESGFHVGTSTGCDQTNANAADQGDGTLTLVSVDPGTCDDTTPAGYAWVVTGTRGVVLPLGTVVDPLLFSGNDVAPRFYGLTLVPFTLSLLGSEATPTATPTGTPSSGSRVYADPLGWSLTYPADWNLTKITRTSDGLGSGLEIQNPAFLQKSVVQRFVVLTITHPIDATSDPSAGSSAFPLSANDFKVAPGPSDTSALEFRIDGVRYLATLRVGTDATQTDVAAMDAIIASIRPTGSATSSSEPPSSTTAGISSSALVANGTLECTVTFPSSTLTPGEPTGAAFTVRNVTSHDLQVGGPTGSLLFARDGQQLQDSSRVQWGMSGPGPALPQTLAPGASMPIRSWDTAVLWSGPLNITPRCDEVDLPALTLDVAAPGAPSDPATALAVATGALGSRFAQCAPTTSGEWVDGTFPFQPAAAARCGGFVDEQEGFDVVAVAAVAPPDAPTVNLDGLPSMIEAVPQFDFPKGTNINLTWWVVVVTGSDNVTCASHSSVTLSAGSESYTGGGTCRP